MINMQHISKRLTCLLVREGIVTTDSFKLKVENWHYVEWKQALEKNFLT